MNRTLALFLIVSFFATTRAKAAEPSALLTQVQAADVLSDLLTWTADRVTARADSMQSYLKELGKLDAFTHQPVAATASVPKSIFYDQLFAGAAQFVSEGGSQYADPMLKNLNPSQLAGERKALGDYDLAEFLYLNRQRTAVASMKAYLQSINALSDYTKWAEAKSPDLNPKPDANASAGLSPEQMVARTEDMMQTARAAALKRAEAAGMSESEFDTQWTAKQAKVKQDVANRVQGMTALAAAFAKMPQSAPDNSPQPAAQRSNGNANLWQDPYQNAFTTTYQGPGEYGTFDSRVNVENDRRVNGEYDRRTNLQADRRMNIQINPRLGK